MLAMEARQEAELPTGSGWQYEPKWDGFRCLAHRSADRVDLQSRSGKPLGRYFPDIVEGLKSLPLKRFTLDGELVIPVGSQLSFESLQLRLHPAATRVAKLAAEQPAHLVVFDILETPRGADLRSCRLRERRVALEEFFAALGDRNGPLRLSPCTMDMRRARQWLAKAGGGILDGVVAKRLDDPYLAGERAMVKVKCMRSADCVIGGFRYASRGSVVGSLLLGLFNEDGKLDHVGFTSGIAETERAALTRKLEKLRGGPGFTGNTPGGPSRWSTERSTAWEPLKPRLVAEVQYDHASGGRFRHGTRFLRWRPDKPPRACKVDQLREEARPGELARMLGHAVARRTGSSRHRQSGELMNSGGAGWRSPGAAEGFGVKRS